MTENSNRIVGWLCAITNHRFAFKLCRVCEERRDAKRKEIIDKGFNDALDVLGRTFR